MSLIPAKVFFVGDLWAWTQECSDFTADDHSLRYIFRSTLNAATHITFDSTSSGYIHIISVPGTITSTLTAGEYMVFVQVVSKATSDVQTVEQGKVTVLPNPSDIASAPSDTRSKWEIAIEKLEAAIAGDSTTGVLEYSIGGRQLKRMPTKDRLEALAYCKRQLAKEKGYPFGRLIKYQFVD